MVDWVGSLNGAAKAPSAATPGEGSGNVPYAPGVMSGNLGQQNTQAPLARQAQMGQPPPAPGGGSDAGQQPAAPPGQAPMPQTGTGSILGPEVYMQILDEYMKALLESTKHPFVGGIY